MGGCGNPKKNIELLLLVKKKTIIGILNIYMKNVRNTEYFNKTHAKARIGNTQPA